MEIAHEDLKRAVLEAGIEHADVALRVLARIDGDQKFRDAVTAAVMTKDPKTIVTLAYGHFEPLKYDTDNYGRKQEPKLPKLVPPVRAGEVVQLLNDRALEVATKLLSNGAIDSAVIGWVGGRLNAIIDKTLGIKDDGFRRISFDQYASNSSVQAAIRARVAKAAEPAVEKALDAIDFSDLTEKIAVLARDEIRQAYDRAAREYLKDQVKGWAENRARLDIEKMLADARGQLEREDPESEEEDGD